MVRALLAALIALFLSPAAFAQGSYTIQPGDVLQFEVLEDPSLNRSLLVLPDGTVSVPLAGSLKASGRSLDSVRGAISSALAPNFSTAPTVFLSVGQLAAPASLAATAAANLMPVYVVGEASRPGRIDVEYGTTLLQFLSQSGFSRFAATKRIQLRRVDTKTGMESVYQFNYKAVQEGAKAPVIVLKKGDVIVIPERKLFE
ncbi:MAG: polysaccharide biosynthesis/export family protein [Paracoccaceae bacterium]